MRRTVLPIVMNEGVVALYIVLASSNTLAVKRIGGRTVNPVV